MPWFLDSAGSKDRTLLGRSGCTASWGRPCRIAPGASRRPCWTPRTGPTSTGSDQSSSTNWTAGFKVHVSIFQGAFAMSGRCLGTRNGAPSTPRNGESSPEATLRPQARCGRACGGGGNLFGAGGGFEHLHDPTSNSCSVGMRAVNEVFNKYELPG